MGVLFTTRKSLYPFALILWASVSSAGSVGVNYCDENPGDPNCYTIATKDPIFAINYHASDLGYLCSPDPDAPDCRTQITIEPADVYEMEDETCDVYELTTGLPTGETETFVQETAPVQLSDATHGLFGLAVTTIAPIHLTSGGSLPVGEEPLILSAAGQVKLCGQSSGSYSYAFTKAFDESSSGGGGPSGQDFVAIPTGGYSLPEGAKATAWVNGERLTKYAGIDPVEMDKKVVCRFNFDGQTEEVFFQTSWIAGLAVNETYIPPGQTAYMTLALEELNDKTIYIWQDIQTIIEVEYAGGSDGCFEQDEATGAETPVLHAVSIGVGTHSTLVLEEDAGDQQ